MNRFAMTGLGLTAVALGVAAIYAASAYQLSGALRQAAADNDEARLAAYLDRAAIHPQLVRQIREAMRESFEADLKGNQDLSVNELVRDQAEYVDELAGRYGSAQGLRGLLRKCDPRSQSARALAEDPEVAFTSRVVSLGLVEVKCSAPAGSSARLSFERQGFGTWRLRAVDMGGLLASA